MDKPTPSTFDVPTLGELVESGEAVPTHQPDVYTLSPGPGWRRLRIEPPEGLYWPGDSEPAGFGEVGLATARFLSTGALPDSVERVMRAAGAHDYTESGLWNAAVEGAAAALKLPGLPPDLSELTPEAFAKLLLDPLAPRGPIAFDAAVKLVEAPLSAFRPAPEAARELSAWLVARFFTRAMPGADFACPSFYRPVTLDLLPPGRIGRGGRRRRAGRGALDEAFVGPCIKKATSSRPHYDALREAAAVLLRARRLDGALADWAANILHPEAKTAAGNPGRRSWTNTLRDKAIVACIARLEAEGMSATRNEVSPSHSACDGVREALGGALSYKTIEGIWNRSRAG